MNFLAGHSEFVFHEIFSGNDDLNKLNHWVPEKRQLICEIKRAVGANDPKAYDQQSKYFQASVMSTSGNFNWRLNSKNTK